MSADDYGEVHFNLRDALPYFTRLGILGVILVGIYLGGVGQDVLIHLGKIADDHMDHTVPVVATDLYTSGVTYPGIIVQHNAVTGDEIEVAPDESAKTEQH